MTFAQRWAETAGTHVRGLAREPATEEPADSGSAHLRGFIRLPGGEVAHELDLVRLNQEDRSDSAPSLDASEARLGGERGQKVVVFDHDRPDVLSRTAVSEQPIQGRGMSAVTPSGRWRTAGVCSQLALNGRSWPMANPPSLRRLASAVWSGSSGQPRRSFGARGPKAAYHRRVDATPRTEVPAGPAGTQLPTGTVTFIFSDIEGSTRLIQEAPAEYPALLERHRALVRAAVERHHGVIFGSEGDALFAAFSGASAGVLAAAETQTSLAAEPWPDGRQIRVRMGLHTGEVILAGGGYVGLALHQVARIMAAGHGGQVLLSAATRVLLPTPLPGDLDLRDLGEHRLKDLAGPERLFELVVPGLPSTFPALRTLANRPNNLPVQLTSFIGRDDLELGRRLLAEHRLLTLTGPGGTGKTRLSLQLAAQVIDAYPGGVFFVPLETIREPDLIAPAIIEAIGVEPGTALPMDRLVEHLGHSRTLLVLDNFEQVVAGAGVVARLLNELPDLSVIVTSRALLRIYGEQELPVRPLSLPEPGAPGGSGGSATAGAAATSEAVRLFVERAMAAKPSFALSDGNASAIADIVRRLDGLPLAIELAAARVRILPIESMRQRLNDRLGLLTGGPADRPERQQTLRAAIDWSHDLLDEHDRRLFRRFAVFAGWAGLAQVERVCGPGTAAGENILDGLGSLVEKSLIRPIPGDEAEPRFAMLVTIREYASERLDASGERPETELAHALAYLELLEQAAPTLTSRMAAAWLDRLELDHDNLRAALDWAVAGDHAEIAFRLLVAIWRFWQVRGHLLEAQERTPRILEVPGAEALDPILRAQALGAAGSIAYWRGDHPAIPRLYEAALDEARRSGDRAALAEALYNAAFAAMPTEPAASARAHEYLNEALAIYVANGDRRGIANANWALGLEAVARRDWDRARGHLEDGLGAYRALDDPFGTGWALHELAVVEAYSNEPDTAEANAREALAIFGRADDQSAAVNLLLDLVFIGRLRGVSERAWRIAGAVDTVRKRSGADLVTATGWFDWEVPIRPDDDPEASRLWDEGAALTLEAAIAYALEDEAR